MWLDEEQNKANFITSVRCGNQAVLLPQFHMQRSSNKKKGTLSIAHINVIAKMRWKDWFGCAATDGCLHLCPDVERTAALL